MDTAATDTLIGQRVFGGYEVTKKIGAGGMGAVYLAENRSLNRKLALKVLLAERSHSPHAVARFIAEAKAASAIQHRNIIDVLDTAHLPDGRHYILMEFLDGETLRQFARSHHPLTLDIILAILAQVCAGLSAAHKRGIIHRDLKPSNIIVAPEPDNPYFTKLLDFGIAKLAAPDLTSDAHTKSRTVAGTPYYMSPEQARALRDVDHRTDIYAVGVIAYELVTGRPPYLAASAGDLVYQQQTTTPVPPDEICGGLPAEWNDAILSAISLQADSRPQTAHELAKCFIDATVGGEEIARATAPLLFTSSVGEPLSTQRNKPPTSDVASAISVAPSHQVPPSGPGPTATDPGPPSGRALGANGGLPVRPPQTEPSGPAPKFDPIISPENNWSQTSGDPAFPAPTRDMRSGPAPAAGVVPTTLGMTASEVSVGPTVKDPFPRGRRTSRRIAVLAGATLAIAAAFLVGHRLTRTVAGGPQGAGDLGGTEIVEPIAIPVVEETPPTTAFDAGVALATDASAAAAAARDGGGDPSEPDGPATTRDRDSDQHRGKSNNKHKNTRGDRDRQRQTRPDAAPIADDDLFDERK